MKTNKMLYVFALLLGALLQSCNQSSPKTSRPNILFIMREHRWIFNLIPLEKVDVKNKTT